MTSVGGGTRGESGAVLIGGGIIGVWELIGVCALGPAIFEREADLGNDAFDPNPAPEKSCGEPRRCEEVLERDKTESESSREVPEEKSVDIFLALLFKGVAIMASKY